MTVELLKLSTVVQQPVDGRVSGRHWTAIWLTGGTKGRPEGFSHWTTRPFMSGEEVETHKFLTDGRAAEKPNRIFTDSTEQHHRNNLSIYLSIYQSMPHFMHSLKISCWNNYKSKNMKQTSLYFCWWLNKLVTRENVRPKKCHVAISFIWTSCYSFWCFLVWDHTHTHTKDIA